MICGPTAAGKTFAALWFARQADVSVISADSRQVYRGFDVGTAKPTPKELTAVPHVGIDILDPRQRFSAAGWATSANAWISEIEGARRVPVVVGGTGLYLRALFGSLFDEPALGEVHREQLQQWLDAQGTEELRRWVLQLDPTRAHLGRTQLLRAIEIALLTGQRVSDLHRRNARAPLRSARYLVVDPGPVLADTIERRVHAMVLGGWQDEVRRLMLTVPPDAPAWNATGYQAIREAVEGKTSIEEAARRITIATRQYAKRQRTWFRHQLAGEDVTRLSTDQPDWAERALAWWKGGDA